MARTEAVHYRVSDADNHYDEPVDLFERYVEPSYVSPHHYGEDINALVDLLDPDRVMFGFDFPHAEGMSGVEDHQERTLDFVDRLRRDEDTTRRVMHVNGLRLLGVGA